MRARGGPEASDAVAAAFFLCGFEGVAVSEDGEVTGYLPAAPESERTLAELRERVAVVAAGLAPGTRVALDRDEVDESEWADGWKRYWRPQRVGARLWIVPSWHEDFRAPEGAVVLRLDPGMAFGTGDHLSTRLALILLEQALRRRASSGAPAPRVLDAGTGSGILAVAAARLAGATVLAVDVDAGAVRVAAENAARNGVADRVEVRQADAGALDGLADPGRFDVIVANILAEVLIPMAPVLARLLAPGGELILSGVVASARDRVEAAYGAAGTRPRSSIRVADWCALSLVGGGQPS